MKIATTMAARRNKKSMSIEVKARTPLGGHVHFEAEGLLVRVLQYEIAHINGVPIYDKDRKT